MCVYPLKYLFKKLYIYPFLFKLLWLENIFFLPKTFSAENNIYFFFRKNYWFFDFHFSALDLMGVGIGGSGGGVYSKVYYSVVGGFELEVMSCWKKMFYALKKTRKKKGKPFYWKYRYFTVYQKWFFVDQFLSVIKLQKY